MHSILLSVLRCISIRIVVLLCFFQSESCLFFSWVVVNSILILSNTFPKILQYLWSYRIFTSPLFGILIISPFCSIWWNFSFVHIWLETCNVNKQKVETDSWSILRLPECLFCSKVFKWKRHFHNNSIFPIFFAKYYFLEPNP
jgi:hypothetical protein